jgi:hypothetical protein
MLGFIAKTIVLIEKIKLLLLIITVNNNAINLKYIGFVLYIMHHVY